MWVVPAWDETRIEPSWATCDTGSPPAWFLLMKVGALNERSGGVGGPGQVADWACEDDGSRPSAPTAAVMSTILKRMKEPPGGRCTGSLTIGTQAGGGTCAFSLVGNAHARPRRHRRGR